MSLKMAFLALLWAREKLQERRRINKRGKIFTILDISSQGQIDGKCSVWGWQPLNDLFTRPESWNSTCRGAPGGRARIWWERFAVSGAGPLTAAGITGVPSSQMLGKQLIPTRLQLPPFMQITCYISLLARAHLHLLLFWLKINAFGLQKHLPRWIFPPRKEPQVKDHFIWSKRGAWEIYLKLNKLFHVSWTQACYKVIWNPGRKPLDSQFFQSLELKYPTSSSSPGK